jgi:broad specificity phosphatase PhoE
MTKVSMKAWKQVDRVHGVSGRLTRRALPGVALLGVALLGAFAAVPRVTQAQPSLVILVRHGEKQPTPANDPSLSEAGVARSEALDKALAGATPGTIVVSATKRTNETAAVVAKRTGVTPTVIALTGAHVKSVAEAVMKASGVVLVVGHSNTVPAIVNALGGPKLPDLCDASYATMFVLQPARDGRPVQVVTSSYGTPDAPGATTCAPPSR